MAQLISELDRNSTTTKDYGASLKTRVNITAAVQQTQTLLRFAFAAIPIVAGLDKFFLFLANWDGYLAPQVQNMFDDGGRVFMMVVGLIEIAAGIGVALKPRIFGYVVAAWLGGIILNLLVGGIYFDVALRDLGLALGALALARLSEGMDRSGVTAEHRDTIRGY